MCDCKTERKWWCKTITFRVANAFGAFSIFSSKPLLMDQTCFNHWFDKFYKSFDAFLQKLK